MNAKVAKRKDEQSLPKGTEWSMKESFKTILSYVQNVTETMIEQNKKYSNGKRILKNHQATKKLSPKLHAKLAELLLFPGGKKRYFAQIDALLKDAPPPRIVEKETGKEYSLSEWLELQK